MIHGFRRWLDRYIYVDRIRLWPTVVFPRMRWWEWPWYVAVVALGAVLMPFLDRWLERLIEAIPVLHYVPYLVIWPALGLLYGLGASLLLPARAARAEAAGEGWLIGFIWLVVAIISLTWFGPTFW